MKTKNYVRITIKRSLLVIAYFSLIGISVHAQDIWKFLLEYETMSENIVVIKNESNLSKLPIKNNSQYNAIPSFLVEVEEEKLKLEDWMLDEKNFNVPENTSFISVPEEDPKLKLEAWMLDERNFEIKQQKGIIPKYASSNYAKHNITDKMPRLEE